MLITYSLESVNNYRKIMFLFGKTMVAQSGATSYSATIFIDKKQHHIVSVLSHEYFVFNKYPLPRQVANLDLFQFLVKYIKVQKRYLDSILPSKHKTTILHHHII